MKPPKPFVGYLVENAGYAPPPRTKGSYIYHLPPLFYALNDARSRRGAFQAMTPDGVAKEIFKVTVTFERVEDAVTP